MAPDPNRGNSATKVTRPTLGQDKPDKQDKPPDKQDKPKGSIDKPDTTFGQDQPDSGNSATKDTTFGQGKPDKPGKPEGISTDKPDAEDSLTAQNGTACYCNTDLCNEAGVSTLQYSGSSYFSVIGVLALTALITLSAANDDDY